MTRLALILALLAGSASAAPQFPIGLWWEAPLTKDAVGGQTEAAATAASNFTILYGFSGITGGMSPWPETVGADRGELALIKSLGLYVVAGPHVPYNDNTQPNSISSVVTLANSIGAQANVLGYAPEDEEPTSGNCGAVTGKPITFAMVPGVVAKFAVWDPTRPTYLNTTGWMFNNSTIQCFAAAVTAVQSVAVASADAFPVGRVAHVQYALPSDFLTVGNDTLWSEELAVQGLRMIAAGGQPVWAYVEGGGDNLVSGTFNTMQAGVSNGSNVLVNAYFGGQAWNSTALATKFTAAWVGLTVSGVGIPTGTTITSIIDVNHAVMSNTIATTACTPAQIPLVLTAGSTAVTMQPGYCPAFTAPGYAFRPVVGNGIPAGTTFGNAIDATHITMSQPATITGNSYAISAAQSEAVTITGGAKLWGLGTGDCVAARNLCVVQGNEYRATPPQVNAEVWMALISGAQGILYFCGDSSAYEFCLGAGADPGALISQANVAYVNSNILSYAAVLNSPTIGACSLRKLINSGGMVTISPSCTGGVLSLSSNTATPGLAMVKSASGQAYLFAMSSARGQGATLSFIVAGFGGKTATVVYDSDARYDPSHSTVGHVIPMNAIGAFSDQFGYGDDYQVRIYTIG